MTPIDPEFLLFAQHGWADDNQAMTRLAKDLVNDNDQVVVVAPHLDYIQTWMRIAPLIQTVEAAAAITMADYPNVPMRIVGHSMGGLIWLEILNRHPRWWARVHSLVLVASPVGGADLGRLIDPFNLGVGIAADLGVNRKPIAEAIAAEIPTLVIAGDIDRGSDGTVPVECTKVPNAEFVRLPQLSHPALRDHPLVASLIREFWLGTPVGEAVNYDEVIRRLHQVPGMTDGHWRDFDRAQVIMFLQNGGSIRTWVNFLGIHHVFVASSQGQCLYAGFVGWLHSEELRQALAEIRRKYAAEV
ncbi:serine aminopeptidase domain-containing protein [Egbenema bharatensis]|uniref:serine aminopeptidase domain-containing protein n=1 Tax=Egbenema bharatensis TaxID=3463334 RepID=UPI003A86D178